jgi:hypothetical protein
MWSHQQVASVQDWSPHMSFILKGSQISTLQLKGWFKSKRQSKNIEIKCKTHIKVVHELHGTCSSTMWRIKNQPSHSTSCSDNALRFLVLVADTLYWGLQVMSSFLSWVMFGRALLREVYIEGPDHVWRALKTSILNTASGHRVNFQGTWSAIKHRHLEPKRP